jgi:tetratricopeptide (TPR) repeat protein
VAFRRAISANPDHAEARFNLRSVFTRLAVYNEAVAIARAGELAMALEKVRRLREFAPNYLPGRRLEGRILQGLGRSAAALRVYDEILGSAPDDPITYSVRVETAKIFEAQGEKDKALEFLRENLRRFPRFVDERARREVRDLLVRLGDKP